jgi:hypothetical protein
LGSTGGDVIELGGTTPAATVDVEEEVTEEPGGAEPEEGPETAGVPEVDGVVAGTKEEAVGAERGAEGEDTSGRIPEASGEMERAAKPGIAGGKLGDHRASACSLEALSAMAVARMLANISSFSLSLFRLCSARSDVEAECQTGNGIPRPAERD